MDEISRQIAKQTIGITDEDLEKLSPGMKKLLTDLPDKMKWKAVAEVTESKYCFAGLKPGDKFIINYPVLNVAESTARPCVAALWSVWNHIGTISDRVAEGLDPNDSVMASQQIPCPDVGLEHGGLGKVWFRVYAERASD